MSIVRNRCQGTAGEDTAGWKNLAGAVVINGGAEVAHSFSESYA
jgi:hypothetical protein